jgi:hypothetical protein
MFRLDWDAIHEATIESWLMANPANRSDLTNAAHQGATSTRPIVSRVATLAISQSEKQPTDPVVVALLEAAMRCCDCWNDGKAARAEMVSDVMAIPLHQRQDLLEHFRSAYGKAK